MTTYCIPEEHLPATIIHVKTSVSKSHDLGDALIEYEYREKVEGFEEEGRTTLLARRADILAAKDGIVQKIFVAPETVVSDPSKDMPADIISKSHVNMTHNATTVTVSQKEAKRMESDTVKRLLAEEKLTLIVDLDQTLIHATVGTSIDEWVNAQGQMPRDIRMFPLPDSPTPYYIKLRQVNSRPHLETFLERVSELYELHIYTMGTRNYADAVSNVIDPEEKFFSHRILSRDENHSISRKSIERLFPCDNSMVVVLDDRADVWQYSPNLIKVHPYEYFVGAGDINAGHLPKQDPTLNVKTVEDEAAESKGNSAEEQGANKSGESVSTSEQPKPEIAEPSKQPKPKTPVLEDNDRELENVLEVLELIHERFYDARENFKQKQSKHDADVKVVIRDLKKSVLHGVHLVFSGVIPLGVPQENTDIWKQAEAYGATCSTDINSHTTHVVAPRAGTSKTTKALARGLKVVKPEWLYHSISKWKKQDEAQYQLGKSKATTSPVSTTPPAPPEEDEEIDSGSEKEDGGVSEGMDENHEPLSVGNNFVTEGLKSMNWDDLDKEVEDFVGDLDDTDFDSDTSTKSNSQSDARTDGNRSPLASLKRTKVQRRSGLGANVTYASSDDEDESQRDTDTMEGLVTQDGNGDEGRSSGESDGEIDEESGSDDDDETASGDDGPLGRVKRRRLSAKESDDPEHPSLTESAVEDDTLAIGEEEDDDEEEEEEEDYDSDFLKDMEDDLEAQMNHDTGDEEA
ncbi:Carboxy-terminal domain (CTD) phosphatase [Podila epigama]|nr:Carboxy-terminal domain (CTD) phosphatase [Podila epigama]